MTKRHTAAPSWLPRRAIVALSLLVAVPRPARAEDTSAQQFLDRIYARYTGRAGAAGIAMANPAIVRQLFEPSLAALILADQDRARRREEPPALDGDPFVDAQDWLISDLRITVTPYDAQHALAGVSFTNLGKPRQLRISLVRLPPGWRIRDIAYAQDNLQKILTATR